MVDTTHLNFPQVGWGYLPASEEIFDVFRFCQKQYNPKCVLEIGFHLGHSTTYQLEIYNQANVIGVSPAVDRIRYPSNETPLDPILRKKMADTLREKYNGRFTWVQGKTHEVVDILKKYDFDFALVDGNHSYKRAKYDIEVCKHLGIKTFLVDNLDQKDVQLACKSVNGCDVIKTWRYRGDFKGKSIVNEIGLCEFK